ncbi:hypothetical protein KAJ83_15675 [Marivibrio halodurans]|uniref:Uncharacterized protein n=1 Tax=Marivibrio halodurans TaxID=2039722 RepID=A0A8J7S252_9PROT|nr:hypothetical protein [Marivibrio halodurans]MBP5858460.1 hypothetical protein [Marivibrio halodurans]
MNLCLNSPTPSKTALIVFSDRTGIGWMRLLPRGFRHCFLILPQGDDDWLMIDSLPGRVALQRFDTAALTRLLGRLTRRGDRVLPIRSARRAPPCIRRMRPFTCVELCIRLLAMESVYVLTPRGLFGILSKSHDESVDKKLFSTTILKFR